MSQERQSVVRKAFGSIEEESQISVETPYANDSTQTITETPFPSEEQSQSVVRKAFGLMFEDSAEEEIVPSESTTVNVEDSFNFESEGSASNIDDENTTFDTKLFQTNIDKISEELTETLKRKYNTDNVKVIPTGLDRDVKTQRDLQESGASRSPISLHNFGAAADYAIYIDDKLVTGSKKDSSLHESTEPYQYLRGIAEKYNYFSGWKHDSGHVAITRFVSDAVKKYPHLAFNDAAKSFYEQNFDKSTRGTQPLMDELDKIYGTNNPNREYTGEARTIDPLLEPMYLESANLVNNNTTEDNALKSQIAQVKAGVNSVEKTPISSIFPSTKPEQSTFNPEGSGYDMEFALKQGLKRDPITGHWPSRDPKTGRLLKGLKHESWDLLVKGEEEEGHVIYKGEDGYYYSQPKTVHESPNKVEFAAVDEAIRNSDWDTVNNIYPDNTVENLSKDLRTNGYLPYINNPDKEIPPEDLVLNYIKSSNYTLSNAPVKDAFTKFKEAVRNQVGDDSIEGVSHSGWSPVRELVANGIIEIAEMGVGMVDFVQTGGEAMFMPEKAEEFASMVGGMLWMMYDEPSNLITATGWDPRPDRNRFSAEGMKKVQNARERLWKHPLAPFAVAVGWKAVPKQFHATRVGMVKQLNKAEAALHYLDIKQKAKKTIELDPNVKFTPEMIELAEQLENTTPQFQQALRQSIDESKQISINFDKDISPPKKKNLQTDPNHKLPFDEPIPTPKKPPTKKQIDKAKNAEKNRYEKRIEDKLRHEHEMLVKNLSSIDEQLNTLDSKNLTPQQIENLKRSRKANQDLIVNLQSEMSMRGIDIVKYMEGAFGLTKAQQRWVQNKLLKGSSLAVTKLNRYIGKGLERGPFSFSLNNEHYTLETSALNDRLNWQHNKQRDIGHGKNPSAWDKLQSELFDINFIARKKIMNSSASMPAKIEALSNLELVRGATSKTALELKNAINTIEKGLKKVDIDKLNGIVQFRREIAIYKRNQKIIPELTAEIKALKNKKRTAEITKKIKEKQKQLNNAKNYKHSLQYQIDPVTLKRVKTEDGKYIIDDPNLHIGNMQTWIKAIELENPKLRGKTDAIFEIYRENLKEMQKLGEEYFDPKQFNELALWDYQQKQYIDKLISYKGDYRQLGSGTIKGIEDFTKSLKAGDAGPLMNDWKYNLGNALNIKNQILFENRANSGLAKFIDDIPDNGFAMKVKPGDKIPADWRVIEYKRNGKSHKIALESNMYESWIRSDAQISSNLAKNIQIWSGARFTKFMATGVQPSFALKNLPRDIMYTYFNSDKFSKHPNFALQMTRAYAQTFKDAALRRGAYTDYIMEGGGMNWISAEGLVKGKNKRLNQVKEVLGYVGETSEVWTRLAVRNQAIKKGLSPRMATAHARGIMDFNSGGRTIKAIDNGIPYLNASMVAARGMGRSFYRNPKDFLIKSGYVAGATTAWWAYNKEFAGDMSSQIHPRESYDYHIVFIPGGETTDRNGRPVQSYIRIPKDSVTKPIAATVEWQMEYMFGDKQRADKLLDIAKYTIGEFSPLELSKNIPPMAGAIMGFAFNKNTYTTYDVYKGDKAVLPRSQTTNQEDEWVRDAADVWNDLVGDKVTSLAVSPAKLQNALSEFAVPHNDFVKIASNMYESRKRDKYGEESIKSWDKEQKTVLEELGSPFYRTTRGVDQNLVTAIKDQDREIKTRNEEYSQMVDKILALDKKGVINGDKNFKEFLDTDVTDPFQKKRLTKRYKDGKISGKFVSEAEWLIKRTSNYSPQAKALAIYHELHWSGLDEESKATYWQELKVGKYLSKEVFAYYSEFISSAPQKEFILKAMGREAYDNMMDRVNSFKPRNVLSQEELELNKGKKFKPITTGR